VRTTVLLAEAQSNVDNTKWLAGIGTDECWRHLEHRRHRRSRGVEQHERASDLLAGSQRSAAPQAGLKWSTMQTSLTTTGQRLVILGDWSGFTIVDRLGAQIELIPHRFGATNRFPQGSARSCTSRDFHACHHTERAALDLLRIAS
jgi:hypothetical protein